ncbi:MAG: MBL fold metallo-hydrolase [Bacillota bacterium]|nr:MBL fold metallo-hydrolase [Bacillota bacterium]
MIKFCSLFSGSSGNSIFISSGETKLLVDAGLSAKKIKAALGSIGEEPGNLSAVLISHEHSDHTKGAGIMSRMFNLPVYANENTWKAMETEIGPVDSENRMYFETSEGFDIGDIHVKAFHIPHDASEPVGFNFFIEGKKVTTATDIGHINDELLSCLEESELLLLESNHDVEMLKVGPYPWNLKKRIMGDRGHLSNETAGKVIAYLAAKGTRRFLLGHLSKENNFPELAYQTVKNVINEEVLELCDEIMLDVVRRDQVGKVIEL